MVVDAGSASRLRKERARDANTVLRAHVADNEEIIRFRLLRDLPERFPRAIKKKQRVLRALQIEVNLILRIIRPDVIPERSCASNAVSVRVHMACDADRLNPVCQ